MFAISTSAALLLLFVVLPVVAGLAVVALVQWRAPKVETGHLTSELLAHGTPATGTLLSVRNHAATMFDRRPMVALRIEVAPEPGTTPREITITQPVPRPLLAALEPGTILELRLSDDRTAGAVVLPAPFSGSRPSYR